MKNPRLTRIAGQLPNLIDPYNGDLLRSNQGYCFLFGVLSANIADLPANHRKFAADNTTQSEAADKLNVSERRGRDNVENSPQYKGEKTSSGEQSNPQNFAECKGKETRQIAAEKAGLANWRRQNTGRLSNTASIEAVSQSSEPGHISIFRNPEITKSIIGIPDIKNTNPTDIRRDSIVGIADITKSILRIPQITNNNPTDIRKDSIFGSSEIKDNHATFTRLHASCSRFRDVSVDSIALQHGGESV